ncbi:glycosyl hydrolase family 18 protein [Nocardioides litoris]|uniref:glycosyl hydrolase family 18 protein n=1 Tax=Nocardioides litoris TaxID=1926648 RepID=UPI0014775A37|nr:glycosyl hydrolase family 18 protein [Nocardioides litoris]
MLRRLLALVLPVVLGSAVLVPAAPVPASSPVRSAPTVLPLTAYAYGSYPLDRLRRDAPAISTLTVVGAALRADGRGVTAPAPDAVRQARRASSLGLRTALLVSNYSDRLDGFDPVRLHRLLSDPDRIAAVARRLGALARAGGWGGVDVDLELVRRGDAAGLVALCRAVRSALPAGSTVTIDISASGSLAGYRDRGYDLRGLAAVVDRVELMAYDQHGPGWSGPGPVGALPWQRRAVATLARVVPRDRIDLGTAGYGYAWTRSGRGWTVTPARARAQAARAGVRPVWHPRAGEWSARLPGGRVLWWADARSLRKRQALAARLGVRGLALWRLGSADPLR